MKIKKESLKEFLKVFAVTLLLTAAFTPIKSCALHGFPRGDIIKCGLDPIPFWGFLWLITDPSFSPLYLLASTLLIPSTTAALTSYLKGRGVPYLRRTKKGKLRAVILFLLIWIPLMALLSIFAPVAPGLLFIDYF